MRQIINEIERFDEMIKEDIYMQLEKGREEVKTAIMSAYDSELVVRNRNSKTNPSLPLYRDEFTERLDKFEYIKKDTTGDIVFVTPDMENFDFSGKLRVIEQVLEGTTGTYVEVSAEDYEKMFGKKVVSADPFDASVPKKEMIYLMRYNARTRAAEVRAFGRRGHLTRYPFSNTPPISILEEGEQITKNNLDTWVKEATREATKRYKRTV
jgi:hypothetical protein